MFQSFQLEGSPVLLFVEVCHGFLPVLIFPVSTPFSEVISDGVLVRVKII